MLGRASCSSRSVLCVRRRHPGPGPYLTCKQGNPRGRTRPLPVTNRQLTYTSAWRDGPKGGRGPQREGTMEGTREGRSVKRVRVEGEWKASVPAVVSIQSYPRRPRRNGESKGPRARRRGVRARRCNGARGSWSMHRPRSSTRRGCWSPHAANNIDGIHSNLKHHPPVM